MTDSSSAHFWYYEEGSEGRPVQIDTLHVERTGAGYFCGRFTKKERLANVRKEAERLWGTGRPTIILEPEGEEFPEWTVYAWLNSTEMKEGCGSHLFLIFFVPNEAFLSNTPRALVFQALRGIKWEEHAEDWDF